MRPEANALNILSTTRATAKMHEFRVAPEDFIELRRDPAILFALAIGILGDVAAVVAEELRNDADVQAIAPLPVPLSWGERDPSPTEGLRFASLFFDAYLNARLDDTITAEFSLLCASAYYLAGNVGSAAVIVRQVGPPPLDLAGGLGRLVYAVLVNGFEAIDGGHAHAESTASLLGALGRFFHFEGEAAEVEARCDELRDYCYKSGSPRELLYADLAGAICAHKLRNASRTILPAASGLDSELWRPALSKPHFPIELWPAWFQGCVQFKQDAWQLLAGYVKQGGVGKYTIEMLVREIETQEILLPHFNTRVGARHIDQAHGALQAHCDMAEFAKYLEVASRTAAKVEYGERRIALDVLQQRLDVLAGVMIARTLPKFVSVLVVMLQSERSDVFQLLPI